MGRKIGVGTVRKFVVIIIHEFIVSKGPADRSNYVTCFFLTLLSPIGLVLHILFWCTVQMADKWNTLSVMLSSVEGLVIGREPPTG